MGRKITRFEDYVAEVTKAFHDRNLGWRQGQAAFNILVWNRPDLSEKVRTTPLDPFYNDKRLPDFYAWVCDNW